MGRQGEVLIIDDDTEVQRGLISALAPAYMVHVASSGEEGLAACERLHPEAVLLDVMLPQMGGLAVLRALKRTHPQLPVIMMTAYAELRTAVQAIKLGASDYLRKPIDPEVVLGQIGHVVTRTTKAVSAARFGVVGESTPMQRVWKAVERFGPTDIPVLLQGETGTGKGVIARAIHQVSARAHGVFAAIDCATIPEQLAESELFGYEDGAFTGAGKKKRGRVAFADRGTLFLDEIGTLPVAIQSKLLMLVEQHSFVPLGARSLQPTHVDVRFISATNVPLLTAVEDGSFRADLFYRLNGVTIALPPLRHRTGDIPRLVRHFLDELGHRTGKCHLDISPEALQLLEQYRWPGNVRELQRVLSVAMVLADGTIGPDDLPEQVRAGVQAHDDDQDDAPRSIDGSGDESSGPGINLREIKEWAGREAQKRVILELQQRGNISRQELARMVGIDPKTLRSRLKEISSASDGEQTAPRPRKRHRVS